MKRLISLFFVMILTLVGSLNVNAQTNFQTLFMFNFMKNISWDNGTQEIKVCVVNDIDLYNDLSKLTSTKKVGNLSIITSKAVNASEIGDANFIVVGMSSHNMITNIAKTHKKAFIVSIKQGQCYEGGACISFANKNGKLCYEFSTRNINARGFNISSKVYQMGEKIN